MSNPIQNFYKSTITQDWSIGPGNFYVSVKPTTSVGRLVVSPSSDTLREIVEYTSTGTDGNGDYIVISVRGVGGTTEQTHTVGEKVRMNITAEDWEDMRDDIDNIVAAGALNASITQKGLVEIATDAEVIAGTETGGTGAILVVSPKTLIDNKKSLSTEPIQRTYDLADSPATWTKPVGLTYIEVKLWAGGGGGGSNNTTTQGAGGGGGACNIATFRASELGPTENITIGAGGAGGGAGTVTAGTAGGNSTFGSLLTSYGGGGGSASVGGGGGGGILSVGSVGTTNGGDGGNPIPGLGTGVATAGASGGFSIYGGGGGGDTASNGGFSIYGGGGGGGSDGGTGTGGGGASIYGGGGGGGEDSGGTGGVSIYGGNGGNGRANGVVPAGGGGGADSSAAAGNGAAGRCIVTEFY